MEIRLLSDHRHDLVVERTRTINRLRWHLVVLCLELEASLKKRSLDQTRVLARVDRRLRRMPPGARVSVARDQVSQIRGLTRQVNALESELAALVMAHRPQLLARDGLRRGDRGDPDRPDRRRRAIPLRRKLRASVRHRADQMLVWPARPPPTQPRRRPPTQPRAAHRRDHSRPTRPHHQGIPRTQEAEGKTKKGALRCLKRHLARRFHHLLALPAEPLPAEPVSVQLDQHDGEVIPEIPAHPRRRRDIDTTITAAPTTMICVR